MTRRLPARFAWRRGPWWACLAALALAACGTVTPTVEPKGPTPTPGASATPAPPTATFTPAPTATPTPIELVVCQTGEPASLYLYGDDVSARAGIFSALFDGPIDSAGYDYQPVILEALPSLEAGTAGLVEVAVQPGERVVDASTGAVVPLVEGVQLAQLDGSVLAYAGAEPARTVQMWAEFSLLPDVRWSDGEPVVAADSVLSFNVAASPDTPVSKFVVDRTARYEAVDTLKARWTGLPGWVDADYALRFWTPLPHHRYGGLGPAELRALPEANDAPLSWGPFMLAPGGWAKGGHLTVVRNPHYFRAAEGLPYVDQVTFRFGMDAQAILDEMAAGHCDVAAAEVDFEAQIPRLLEAQASGALAPQFVADNVFEHLDFGVQPAEGYRRAAGNDLFQDVRVRQAVAYCLDRQALIDQLQYGLAEVPAAYVPAAHPAFAGDQLARYGFDPARGQALLDEAGWVDANGDGVRERSRRRLSVELVSGPAGNGFREALLQFISGQLLSNCGIEAQPALLEAVPLYDPWPSGRLFGRQFDLAAFPWRTGIRPPCDLYLSSAIPSDQNPGGANNTGWSHPDFDGACLAALRASDPAAWRAQHQAAQVIFSQELPSLPLFFHMRAAVALPRVDGYAADPTAADLWNVEQIRLLP